MSGFKVNFSVNNQLSTPSIHAAPLAQRPAAGQPGRVFIDSDNPSTGIYRDTGTTWVVIGMPSSPDVDTLQTVTDRGNTTTQSITVGSSSAPIATVDVRRATAALNNASDYGLVSVNTPLIPGGASFGVNFVNAVNGSQALTFGGSATIGNTGLNSAGMFINTLGSSSPGTITVGQSTTIRTLAAIHSGVYFNTAAATTFTHVANIKTIVPINSGAAAATVTNYYGVLVSDSTPSSGTINYTNRYGIYQEGLSDINYFAGNTGISTPNPVTTFGYRQLTINSPQTGPSYGSALDLQLNQSTRFRFQCDSTSVTINSTTQYPIYFDGNGSTKMTLFGNTGNLAIGTTVDPGLKFFVNGNSQISGYLNVISYAEVGKLNSPNAQINNIYAYSSSGTLSLNCYQGDNAYVRFGNQFSNNITAANLIQAFNGQSFVSIGTGTINVFQINPIINQTTGTGNIYGFRFNPTNTAVLSTVWAFYADSGRGYFNDVLSIGTTTPNAAALLQIDSTTKGFLPPRMTDAQITAIATPPAGLFVYSTTQNCPAFYDGTGWRKVSHSAL